MPASFTTQGRRRDGHSPKDRVQDPVRLPTPQRPLCCTLDGGLGLAAEVARGAERASRAGRARRHPHAQPLQVAEAVRVRLGLVLQLLPVPCRAWGARQQLVPKSLRGKELPGSAAKFSLRSSFRPHWENP